MALLEALAHGVPAVYTTGCNFPEVMQAGAGIEVDATADGTERGLRQLMGASDTEYAERRDSARRLVQRNYTWDQVAGRTLELYRWLASGGDRPEFVEIG